MNLGNGIPVINSRNGPGSVIGKTISTVAGRLLSVSGATVVGTDFPASSAVPIELDTGPGVTLVVRSLGGTYPGGTRVFVLSYPPRGMVILGAINTEGWDGDPSPSGFWRQIRLLSTVDVALSGDERHAFQIGLSGEPNLAMDTNEIQARDNGLNSRLDIQAEGGDIRFGLNSGLYNVDIRGYASATKMRPMGSHVNGTISTTSSSFVDSTAPSIASMPYPPSGTVMVSITARIDAAAASSGVYSFELRDDGGGTVRFASSDQRSAIVGAGLTSGNLTASRTVLCTGLPTTGDMEIQGQIRSSGGASVTFREMELVAVPCL